MASTTQDMRFRLSLINYADRYGVSNFARKYKTNQPVYLSLEKPLRWFLGFSQGSFQTPSLPSKSAHSWRDQTDPRYAQMQSPCRTGRFLDKTYAAWIETLDPRSLPFSQKNKGSWPGNFPILNTSQSLMCRRHTQDNGYRSMLKFVPASCLVNEAKGKRFY